MYNYKLKHYKLNFKKYKNPRAITAVTWNKEMIGVCLKANKLLDELEQNNYNLSNGEKVFTLEYKGLPAKTTRIKLRKKIHNYNYIPQIDMTTIYHDKETIHSKLTFKITSDEYNSFIDSLKEIRSLGTMNEEIFQTLNTNLQSLIASLRKVLAAARLNDIEKITDNQYLRILPIYEDKKLREIFQRYGIEVDELSWATFTIFVTQEQYEKLKRNHPEIMGSIFPNQLYSVDDFVLSRIDTDITLDEPNGQVIGVIDSGIDLPEHFQKYYEYYDERKYGANSDKAHGSGVTSLIIANDKLNPTDGDNEGQFTVRHFEVLEPNEKGGTISVEAEYLKNTITKLVKKHQDIKVWNLSLGSLKTPYTLNMSPLGKQLDWLSKEYDCLFVVAAGNQRAEKGAESLNTPADSYNALSVGSVGLDKKGKEITYSDYSSYGSVSHFSKPEVSHFGGPVNHLGESLKMQAPNIVTGWSGTSFAAPKISRIAARLINEGYSPLEAKAAIISMSNRETQGKLSSTFGYIKNTKEEVIMRGTIELDDNKRWIMPFQIPHGTKEITIATSAYTTNNHSLGEEYNLANVDIDLIKYDPSIDEVEYERASKTLEQKPKHMKFKTEKNRRYLDGKYFTSKKKTYSLQFQSNKLEFNQTYGLRLKRLTLFDTTESYPLEVGYVMNIKGTFTKEELEEKFNQQIEIETEIEIDV